VTELILLHVLRSIVDVVFLLVGAASDNSVRVGLDSGIFVDAGDGLIGVATATCAMVLLSN